MFFTMSWQYIIGQRKFQKLNPFQKSTTIILWDASIKTYVMHRFLNMLIF